jgi:ribosomal protein S20
MKLIKNVAVAATLVLSLGSFSTTATADICLGMACMYNRMTAAEGIDATLGKINDALEAIKVKNSGSAADDGKAGDEVIIGHIKEALKLTKEINANDKLDRNRNRANGYLKKAREAIQAGDMEKATEDLKEADRRFAELKGMIDLTQADRVSQQTNLLNRIMDTPDTAAGARK